MVRIDGLGALVSLIIFVGILYLAYQWGKTGTVTGGFKGIGGGLGGQNLSGR